MLELTFRNGDTAQVTFNHESVLAVTNLETVEAGVTVERRHEWTDVESIVFVEGDPQPAAATTIDGAEIGETSVVSSVPDLKSKGRDELNAIATSMGITDPEKLPNKQAVKDAIAAKAAKA